MSCELKLTDLVCDGSLSSPFHIQLAILLFNSAKATIGNPMMFGDLMVNGIDLLFMRGAITLCSIRVCVRVFLIWNLISFSIEITGFWAHCMISSHI